MEIVERWARRVLADPAVPSANPLTKPVLEEDVPQLIDMLIDRLARGPSTPPRQGAQGTDGSARSIAASGIAVSHAQRRVAIHYTLAETLRELSHLRTTILDLCEEERFPLGIEASKLIHATIDDLMTTSAAEIERSALREREEVMAIVAHDLRNPLGTMAMQAARIQAGKVTDPATIADALIRNTRRMQRLIEDLLVLARLDAGHLSVHAEETDVVLIVRDACEQLRPFADRQNIALSTVVPPREVRVMCDQDRILQALGNLVANAIKFTANGGRVQIVLEAREGDCVFRVIDSGIGIRSEHLADVFRPFWRVPDSGKQGVGLGLAIARGIIEAHCGTISVESTVGQGTTFLFTLPYSGTPKSSATLRVAVPRT